MLQIIEFGSQKNYKHVENHLSFYVVSKLCINMVHNQRYRLSFEKSIFNVDQVMKE